VSPIINADAVDAVREGLRIELPRASIPAAPPKRAAGKPRTRAIGGTSVGASIDTPMKTATAPIPIASRCTFVDPPPKSPKSIRPNASTITTIAMYGPNPRQPATWAAPRLRALRRSARHAFARSAGRMAAISVEIVPTRSATNDGSCGEDRRDLRQVDAEGDEELIQELRETEPEEEPDHGCEGRRSRAPRGRRTSTPAAASRRACAALQARASAARPVMPIVLAITKIPTKSAT